jgi:hypothetical protein
MNLSSVSTNAGTQIDVSMVTSLRATPWRRCGTSAGEGAGIEEPTTSEQRLQVLIKSPGCVPAVASR